MRERLTIFVAHIQMIANTFVAGFRTVQYIRRVDTYRTRIRTKYVLVRTVCTLFAVPEHNDVRT